jgi:hypothetical protein
MRFVVGAAVALLVAGPVAAGSPGLGGSWAGEMRQIEVKNEISYPMTLSFAGKGATATYPTLNCSGTWTRVTQKNGYVVYTEKARNQKGAACVDGMVMVTIDQGKVVLAWFAAFDGAPIVSTAVLSKAAK